MYLENSIRCLEADYALAKAGLVRVSINPRATPRDVTAILEDATPRALVYGSNFAEMVAGARPADARFERVLRVSEPGSATETLHGESDHEDVLATSGAAPPSVPIEPEDLYCLFYTSGTTGRPKGVMLSHRAILQTAYNLLLELGPHRAGEKVLLLQPLSHGSGFFMLPWFMRGGAVVVMRKFQAAEVVRLMRDFEIETIKLVPTMLQRVLEMPGLAAGRFPNLRQIIYGASTMPVEPLKKAIEIFGPRLSQVYGQSEAPVTLSFLPTEDHEPGSPVPERLTSAGRPRTTVEIRVVDEAGRDLGPGEVIIRGPHMMTGDLNRPDATAKTVRDGWLHTNDLGRLDPSGYLYLLGRMDEMIISGGYNVSPREVEDVLYEHPAIREAAVIGVPDPEWGQAIEAYVAIQPGKSCTARRAQELGLNGGRDAPARTRRGDHRRRRRAGTSDRRHVR